MRIKSTDKSGRASLRTDLLKGSPQVRPFENPLYKITIIKKNPFKLGRPHALRANRRHLSLNCTVETLCV